MRLLVWTASSGFFGQDGDRQAGYERSRCRILMNSFSYGSYHPAAAPTAFMFNYSRRGKSSDFQLVKQASYPDAGPRLSPETRKGGLRGEVKW